MTATGDIGGISSHPLPPPVSPPLQVWGRTEGLGQVEPDWAGSWAKDPVFRHTLVPRPSSPSPPLPLHHCHNLQPPVAKLCLSLVIFPGQNRHYLLLKITPWKVHGPISLRGLGPGHWYSATQLTSLSGRGTEQPRLAAGQFSGRFPRC